MGKYMTMNDDYRSRAKVVRQAAREHLYAIRKARLARTDPSAAAGRAIALPHSAFVAAEELPFPVSPELAEYATEPIVPCESVDVASTSDTAGEHMAVAGTLEPGGVSPPPPRKKPRKAQKRDASPAPSAGTAVPEILPAPANDKDQDATPSQDAPAQIEPRIDAESPTASEDLLMLPGAGEGLVWMLGQCGVSSLADLAACNPSELGRQLGLVGKILNVDSWVEFARNRSH